MQGADIADDADIDVFVLTRRGMTTSHRDKTILRLGSMTKNLGGRTPNIIGMSVDNMDLLITWALADLEGHSRAVVNGMDEPMDGALYAIQPEDETSALKLKLLELNKTN